MDFSTILEGIKTDLIYHIKLLREDVEKLKKEQSKDKKSTGRKSSKRIAK